ncbi:Uncharacterised protein [uncultured archaeon]|nr:Uncharacterised protein [uncultured archaeon]
MTAPSFTFDPFLMSLSAWNCHFFFLSMALTVTPLAMKSPLLALITSSGLCTPSNIFESMPGPSSTDSGLPVDTTSSPGLTPLVSS